MTRRVALAFLLLTIAPACAATSEDSDATEPGSATADLTSVPTGTFVIDDEPSSGSYVSMLTLSTGKRFELEYVRVTTTYETSFFSPFVPLPTRHEEKVVSAGKYRTFEGDPGETLIAFEIENTADSDHRFLFSFAVAPATATSATSITLGAIGSRPFTLRKTTAAPAQTDGRVLSCEGRKINAVITLDEAQRRRGTMRVTRKAGELDWSSMDPPNAELRVVHTGGTGVQDYMAYEGRDSKGNTYSFALKASDLEKTSGPISHVGMGFGPDDFLAGGGEIHHGLDCTISRL